MGVVNPTFISQVSIESEIQPFDKYYVCMQSAGYLSKRNPALSQTAKPI